APSEYPDERHRPGPERDPTAGGDRPGGAVSRPAAARPAARRVSPGRQPRGSGAGGRPGGASPAPPPAAPGLLQLPAAPGRVTRDRAPLGRRPVSRGQRAGPEPGPPAAGPAVVHLGRRGAGPAALPDAPPAGRGDD